MSSNSLSSQLKHALEQPDEMADVLSYPARHDHLAGPHSVATPPHLGPRRLPSEDILTETLAYPDQPDQDRDYTDDLEDLVRSAFSSPSPFLLFSTFNPLSSRIYSIKVTQQLHSRRSQQTINTMSYLPSRESTNSFQNLPLSSSDSTSPTSPTQRSLIPRRQGNTSSRSPSPEVPRELSTRSGSISSSHSLSRIPSPINPVAMSRGNSNQSATSSNGIGESGEDKWETLQVGNKQLSTRTPTPRSKTTNSSKPFPSSSTSSTSRQSSKPSPDSSNPRKRAQTNLSTSPSSSSTTPRKPYQNRTNLVPSPSSSHSTRLKKSSTSSPPTRQKSLSTTTATREFSSYPSYSDSDAFPLPSALVNTAPQVFVNDEGEFVHEGRADQLVIPTVARRIEAERLRKLMDRGEAGLVSEWGVDGLPRVEGKWKERMKRDGGEGERIGDQQQGAMEEKETGEERNGSGNTPYSDHPYASNEPVEPQPPQIGSRKTTSNSNSQGQTLQTPPTTTTTKERDTKLEKNPIQSQAQRDKDVEKAGCCSCVIC